MTLLFDIGASHMRLALATEEGIGPVERVRTPKSPEEALTLFKEVATRLGAYEKAVGGIAAIVSEDNSILFSTNLEGWNEFPFSEGLGVPVVLRNDAELNGLGEATYGAGKGTRTVAYLGLGTGVGTSLIVDGQVVPHSSDGAMRERIIELVDGTDLEERIGGHALKERFGVASEEFSKERWDSLMPPLLEGVRNALEAWTPDILVLGGSLMNEEAGFSITAVRAAVGGSVRIERGTLGDSSGIWGARALV